jgi:3-deoxy-D-manno-octulosonate 8-phosphate phosphatase KdsC-like HAD superfamily phosphatase
VGIGDAENDLPFLRACGFAATVDNALDVVKAQCQFVATRDHGEGVEEVIDAVLRGTIEQFPPKAPSPSHSASASHTKLATGN